MGTILSGLKNICPFILALGQYEGTYVLELNVRKCAILTFTRLHPAAKSIHLQMGNIAALSYFIKMGWTRNETLSTKQRNLELFTARGNHD